MNEIRFFTYLNRNESIDSQAKKLIMRIYNYAKSTEMSEEEIIEFMKETLTGLYNITEKDIECLRL